MRLATRENILRIDTLAASDYHLKTAALVDRVGENLKPAFLRALQEMAIAPESLIIVWCGPGNNGADGKALAKHLIGSCSRVQIEERSLWPVPADAVLVDAYFGVGLSREITGDLRKQIEKINAAGNPCIAIDLPSGLDANRGIALGVAVRADWTLTISPPKPGLFLQDGPATSGRIRKVDIGFPQALLEEVANEVFLIGNASAKQLLPPRKSTGNKTSYGNLLVIAGATGSEGAARMTCEAAARMGCGYVTLCSPSESGPGVFRPDYMRLSVSDFWKNDLRKYTAVVVGPGLGVNEETAKILQHLQRHHAKVLVDADALTVYAQRQKFGGLAKLLPGEWVLTPHAGELSRITGRPALEIEEDRLKSVKEAQNQCGAHVLLKGFRTVLRNSAKTYIIGSGNKALSKAGAGDILSGFIGSLMAQGLASTKAAVLGAYLHGRIADDWLRRGHDSRILMASDLPELLDASLRSLKKSV